MSLPIDLPTEEKKNIQYKIRHKPTGFFYRPNGGFKGLQQGKSNITRNGKYYTQRPKLNEEFWYLDQSGRKKLSILSDWEVVEYYK
jgi:hypothetical protein